MKTKILIIAVAFFMLVTVAPRAFAGWNYITLSSYYAFPGQTITVDGNGFSPGESVTVSVGSMIQTTTANSSGQFTSANFTIPYSDIGMTVPVNASAPSGSGSANLVVGTYYPHVTPSSWFLAPGSQISFSGTNFAPSEQVAISSQGSTIGTVIADNSGSFTSQSFTLPYSGSEAGFSFTGQSSHTSDSLTVKLAIWGPVITLNNYAGPASASIAVNGNGFGSNEGVNLNFNGQLWGFASSTQNGTLSFNNTVPSWATQGPNTIVAIGNSTNGSAQTVFTLLSAPSSMPSVQNQGAQISVVSVDRIKSNLSAGQTATTITPRLISSGTSATNITIHVQLLTSNGDIATEQIYSGQTLSVNSPMDFPLTTPANLSTGNYTIAVQIYNPDNSILASFSNLGIITVQ